MRETITQILTEAINAPSGSNSQPWRFEVTGNAVKVIAEPEKDHPIFNYRNRGTLVAHGALIANIEIIAHARSFNTDVLLLPQSDNTNITARIIFSKANLATENKLAAAIPERSTNRKSYENSPLLESERAALLEESNKTPGVLIRLIETPEGKKALGENASVNEVVMFKNKTLHDLFFKEILWDSAIAQKGESGLYVKTMELAKPQEKVVRILSRWPMMQIANTLGLSRKIAADNAKSYASCAAMIGFMVDDNDKAFIEVGRALERIWLTATSLGLSAQMLTGSLFMYQQIAGGNASVFSKDEQELIKNAYGAQAEIFQASPRQLAIVLRIGRSEKPTAFSAKKLPTISFLG